MLPQTLIQQTRTVLNFVTTVAITYLQPSSIEFTVSIKIHLFQGESFLPYAFPLFLTIGGKQMSTNYKISWNPRNQSCLLDICFQKSQWSLLMACFQGSPQEHAFIIGSRHPYFFILHLSTQISQRDLMLISEVLHQFFCTLQCEVQEPS